MKNNKKILYFVTEDWYFYSHRIDLARDAIKSGYEVVLLTNVNNKIDEISKEGIRVIPLNINRAGKNIFNEIRTFFNTLILVLKEKPDIIHNVSIKPIIYGTIVGIFSKSKIINTFAGLGVLSGHTNIQNYFQLLIIFFIRILMKSKRVSIIVQNNDDMNFFIKRNIAKKNQIHLILGSGVDEKKFDLEDENDVNLNVLLASRMLWSKGIKEFVEAAEIVNRSYPLVNFIIAGRIDNKNPDGVNENYLKNLGYKGYIKWIGHTEDMKKLFTLSNIVCLPTFYGEGIPKVIIEACASRRAVITSNIAGCKEIVEDGFNGILIEPKNSKQLATAIVTLITSTDLRHKYGLNGRKLVQSKFSLDIINRQTLELYNL